MFDITESLILGVCILLRVWDQGEGVFRLHVINIVGFHYLFVYLFSAVK
jgi:hypothetical protein